MGETRLVGGESAPGDSIPYAKITVIIETPEETVTLVSHKVRNVILRDSDHDHRPLRKLIDDPAWTSAMDVNISFIAERDEQTGNFMWISRPEPVSRLSYNI